MMIVLRHLGRYASYLVWTSMCIALFLVVSAPLVFVAFGIGFPVGVVLGLASVAGVLMGGDDGTDLITPAAVAAGQLSRRDDQRSVRRDRAWPQYFAAQVKLDIVFAARRNARHLHAVWVRGTQPLRTSTGEKLVLLWPALIVGAAAFVALAAGGIAILAATACAAATVTVLSSTIGLITVICLRALDRVWQRLFRTTAICPRCYRVTAVPTYRCPGVHTDADRMHGDDLHRDIRPGILGICWRRCSCGMTLPTTVLRASRRLDAHCPSCSEPLPPGAGSATGVSIGIFGAESAGKTRLIGAAVMYLVDPAVSATTQPMAVLVGEHSVRTFERNRMLNAVAEPTPPTDAKTRPFALTLELAGTRRKALLHFFDAAGSALAEPAISSTYSYLESTRALVFVLDPFSIAGFRDRLGAGRDAIAREAHAARADPESSYQSTVTRLRRAGVRTDRQRLAFVLTKRDLLARLPTETLPDGPAEVRQWLFVHGMENLVICAERDFATVGFFAVSSQDHSAAGPVAPFRWLLETDRVHLPRLAGYNAADRQPRSDNDAPRRGPKVKHG